MKIRKPRPKGPGEFIGVRVRPEISGLLDDWRRKQPDIPSRAEAIRRLVEAGLKATSKHRERK